MLARIFCGHVERGDGGAWCSMPDHAGEIARVKFATVGAAEDPAAAGEAGVCESDEVCVIFFDTKDLAFIVAGEGGGVEDDAVKRPALSGETFQPVEGIAFAEKVVGGVEVVDLKICFCPVEVDLGEVEGGGGGAPEAGADGKGTGVGEGVEDGFSRRRMVARALSVQALIEKNPL